MRNVCIPVHELMRLVDLGPYEYFGKIGPRQSETPHDVFSVEIHEYSAEDKLKIDAMRKSMDDAGM